MLGIDTTTIGRKNLAVLSHGSGEPVEKCRHSRNYITLKKGGMP